MICKQTPKNAMPRDYEAECALLGSMILDGNVICEVLDIVRHTDEFYTPKHRHAFAALVDLHRTGDPIDMVNLKSRLDDKDKLEAAGGLEYLLTLAESVPSATSAAHYAQRVHDKAVARRLIDAAHGIVSRANGREPVRDQVLEAERAIFKISKELEANGDRHATMNSIADELYDSLESTDARGKVSTGYPALDDLLQGGLHNGDVVVLAARTSHGKTSLALGMYHHVAISLGLPAAMFSLEMSRIELARRIAAIHSRRTLGDWNRHGLTGEDLADAAEVCSEIGVDHGLIHYRSGTKLSELASRARRWKSERDIRLIVVDYLQLVRCPGADSRRLEVSEVSRGLKELAGELDIPILVLAQLNRSAEGREDHLPRLTDIKECGNVEEDADVVLLLHREDRHKSKVLDDWEHTNTGDVIVAKHRNGPTGKIELFFDAPCAAYRNWDS